MNIMKMTIEKDKEGKPYPNIISFKTSDILSLTTLGSIYDDGNINVNFHALSKYSSLTKVRVSANTILDLLQLGVQPNERLVAKKHRKYWHVTGQLVEEKK
tara:strand:+ start:163 stop:465 length:303 start_codon:yes stop_codon:yes gene_type:complete